MKIKSEILPEERMNGQEVFYLTYTPEDVEGNVQLETGDKINFVIDNNKHTGAVSARNIMLLKKKQARCQGVVCAMKEAFGFIERGDIVKEIFFHYSEFKGDIEALQLEMMWNSQSRIEMVKKLQQMSDYCLKEQSF